MGTLHLVILLELGIILAFILAWISRNLRGRRSWSSKILSGPGDKNTTVHFHPPLLSAAKAADRNNASITPRLEDLFDVAELQTLQDAFASATGVAAVIVAPDGTLITRQSNGCEACNRVKATPAGEEACTRSNSMIGSPCGNGPNIGTCLGLGFLSSGSPIFIGDQHIGSWMFGQIRSEDHSIEKLATRARKLGVTVDDDFLKELRSRTPMSKEHFHEIAILAHHMATHLSQLAYRNWDQNRQIASRYEIEKTLAMAKENAEKANHAKSEFIANMSHEIRTPMTAILGFADVLRHELEETKKLNYNEAIDSLQTIRRNSNHLLEIINEILDISQIESGKIEVQNERANSRDIIEDVVKLMQGRVNEKGLTLELEYTSPIPDTIETDPTRLKQVLINILGNAIKFTEIGRVDMKVSLVNEADNPKLQIVVSDTGIGIPAEKQTALFQPFSQGDASVSKKFGGTGLGLAISRRLARLLGGDITFSSALGLGSSFAITVGTGSLANIRLTQKSQSVIEAPSPGKLPSKREQVKLNCRILLAEDGLDNQRLIKRLLTRLGANVQIAENGQKAIEYALKQDNRFDMILMDMQMPVMNGYDAVRKLREEAYTGPIIALTASAMREDRGRCLAAGCNDYLAKPINSETLREMIQRYIRRENSQETPKPASSQLAFSKSSI